MTFKEETGVLVEKILEAVHPKEAVKRALCQMAIDKTRPIYLVAVGKAAWSMAESAYEVLGETIVKGMVLTKYDHVKGPIGTLQMMEAGHPVPDQHSYQNTEKILQMVETLSSEDQVLFLLSGGGSALFEKPLLPEQEMEQITQTMLEKGASIVEINTIRKRLSGVKGGRFAKACAPATIYQVVLSDIIGDPLDMIASGPACEDTATIEEAKNIAKKYQLPLSKDGQKLLEVEMPKNITNVKTCITGSVKALCEAAIEQVKQFGYRPVFLTDCLSCEARQAGAFLGAIAKSYQHTKEPLAFICGGETVVHVTGKGKGGRNQELALAAAEYINGMAGAALFSLGSDGTDGPTDSAGGFVQGSSAQKIEASGRTVESYLEDNDAYHGLQKCQGLLMTGPTGTNVNDVTVLLLRPTKQEM